MSLENIKKEIEAKAESVKADIIAEAETKVKEIQDKAREQVADLEAEAQKKLEAELALVKNRELSLANMQVQKKLFEARKEELTAVYAEAEDKIMNMPEAERQKAVEKMLAKASDQIDVSVVYAGKKDAGFVKDCTVKEIDTGGCIICETKDGSVRVDYTFPTLFADIKEKTLADVSKKLFD